MNKAIKIIEKGFTIKRRLPEVEIDPAKLAMAAEAVAASIERRLFAGINEAICQNAAENVATQMLKFQWQMNDDQLAARLEQIRSTNPGEWESVTLAQLWQFVFAGLTFDESGKLEPESLPFVRGSSRSPTNYFG